MRCMRMKIAWMLAGGMRWKRLGLQQRRHPVAVTPRPSLVQLGSSTSYWPVWSQVISTSSRSLSIMMYSMSPPRAR
jgi:hypothetical protein